MIGLAALGLGALVVGVGLRTQTRWREGPGKPERLGPPEFTWLNVAWLLVGAVCLGGAGLVAHRINALSLQPGVYFLTP